jgi:hypothetical protein
VKGRRGTGPGHGKGGIGKGSGGVISGRLQSPPEGSAIRIETDDPAGKEAGQGFGKPAFVTAGKGGEETPGSGVFQLPQDAGGGVAQDGAASVLPEVRQTAAVSGVEPEVPGAADGRQGTEKIRPGKTALPVGKQTVFVRVVPAAPVKRA